MAWLDFLVPLSKDIGRIATALERIVDHLDGNTPLRELPPEPDREPPVIAHGSADDITRGWIVEQQLRDILGRDPDPDEVIHAMDDIEWGTDDAQAQLRKVRRAADAMTRGR